MTYVPLNIDVYTAAFSGAMAGVGVPSGAFIVDPVQADYEPIADVATVYAQAVDTAWGTASANAYDIEAIADASSNLFARGAGYPIEGDIITQDNWTIVATALVAMIRQGDATATSGGIVFPPAGGGITPPPFGTSQQLWVAASWGSDTTGTGSIFQPFQTIGHAQSVITDASGTKLYEIILYPGEYTENVAIKAFTKIVGFDPTQSELNSTYPADLSGDISLGTSFATTTAIAWLTGVELDGSNFHIDFIAAGTTNGLVSITNCQFSNDISVNMGANHIFELHGVSIGAEYLQIGGRSLWENTVGDSIGAALTVRAGTNTGSDLQMFNSCWMGSIDADQHGNANPGEVVTIEMINSQARNGSCTLTATGSNVPTIDAAYGDTPENPVLAGSSANKLSRQMRVSLGLHVPSGTVIGALSATNITIPLSSGIIGAASIEEMSCTITPNGSGWGTEVAASKCNWSTYVVQNGLTSEIHFVFNSQNDSPITLSTNLPFLFYGFLPNIIG